MPIEKSTEPTADERAGMEWWNGLSEPERAGALKAVGWTSRSLDAPSVADAWTHYKKISPHYRHPH